MIYHLKATLDAIRRGVKIPPVGEGEGDDSMRWTTVAAMHESNLEVCIDASEVCSCDATTNELSSLDSCSLAVQPSLSFMDADSK